MDFKDQFFCGCKALPNLFLTESPWVWGRGLPKQSFRNSLGADDPQAPHTEHQTTRDSWGSVSPMRRRWPLGLAIKDWMMAVLPKQPLGITLGVYGQRQTAQRHRTPVH